jgi:tetratricopeptide (TPR) repeat protein
LKAAKTALQEKSYSTALYNAELALRHDPGNYHARVFMGLAHFNLEDFKECEKWYSEALDVDGEELLAYQVCLISTIQVSLDSLSMGRGTNRVSY